MNSLARVLTRLDSFIAEIEELEQSEFPYDAPRAALRWIKGWFCSLRKSSAALGISPSADEVKEFANETLVMCEKYLPILGFMLRATNVRNGFEVVGPLRRLAEQLLLPDHAAEELGIQLILSSEWEYMPMFRVAADLPRYVMIGLPAHESSNPLLYPLCGHELGHALWDRGGRDSIYFAKVRDGLDAVFRERRREFVKVFPHFEKCPQPPATVQGDLFAESYDDIKFQTVQWAVMQAEESFCDFVGLRLFGRAYFLAYTHLLFPGNIGPRLPGYPNTVARIQHMMTAFEAYGISKDGLSCDPFADRPGSKLPSDQLLMSFADETVNKVVGDLIEDVDQAAKHAKIPPVDVAQVERIKAAFHYVVPSGSQARLADILNAGWKVFEDDTFWVEYEHIHKDKVRILRDLLLKSIELIEVEEIRIEMEKRYAAPNRGDS